MSNDNTDVVLARALLWASAEWVDVDTRIREYESAKFGKELYFSVTEKIAWDNELERLRNRKREIEAEIAKEAVAQEPPKDRANRLRKRVAEERAKRNRAFNKTVAKEEGISLSRLKEILGPKEKNPLASTSGQAVQKKLDPKY